MAIKTGSLGPLLQGVSQQPDRIRLEGQVTEQVNLVSDVTNGLTTRANTVEVADLGTRMNTNFRYITLQGQKYLLEYTEGYIGAYTLSGQPVTLTYEGSASSSYIGPDMRFVVVGNEIVMTNRDTTVSTLPAPTKPAFNVAVVWCMAGEFSRMYRVSVSFSNWPTIEAEFRTPAGDQSGDGLNATTEAIIEALADGLRTHPDKPTDLQVDTRAGYMLLYHPVRTIRVTTSDGATGENLKSVVDTVKDVADLPKYAPNGMVVQVQSSKSNVDNYWLKYNAKDITGENGFNGFWREGIWSEWKNPYIVESFNLGTMPHIIKRSGNTLVVARGPWLSRQVGDDKSAPLPSIVGKRIRDVGGFESRLVLLTTSTIVMSRTNFPFDLWRESATVISDSDPIDMTSTKKNELRLDWLVAFDRDMFLVSDPGDSQFVVRGGGITPTNASMVLTTEYSIESGNTAPVSTGRTLLLPFVVGEYSGIQEYYTNSDNSAQSANGLTETVAYYIKGKVDNMQVNPNFNFLALTTDAPDSVSSRTIWTYKYLWDGQSIVQSCWSKWVFSNEVRYHFFDSSRMYIVVNEVGGSALEYMDLNRVPGVYGYAPTLDSYSLKVAEASGEFSRVTHSKPNCKFIQHTGCANPGLAVVPESASTVGGVNTYTFNTAVVPVGATVMAGVPIMWELYPTEVFARDYQQRVDTSKNVVIQEYMVRVKESGVVKADFISPYAATTTYFEELYPMDQEPLYPTGTWLVTDDLIFPWGERADWSKLRLWGDDYRPVNINEVAWAGQITAPRGTRV